MLQAVNQKSQKIVEDIFGRFVPGNETNIDCYSEYAKYYDEGLTGIQYDNPKRFATMALKHVKTNSTEMQALDICAGAMAFVKKSSAALGVERAPYTALAMRAPSETVIALGTGLMAQELVRSGFNGHVDAIDGNETMMAEAKKKGIYRNFVKMIITPDAKLPFPDNTYDIALCGGAFSEGHLRSECLWEFIRILKQGGALVFNTTNCDDFTNQLFSDGLDKADAVINEMVKRGVCEIAESKTCECFSRFSDEFQFKEGNTDLIRCCVKL